MKTMFQLLVSICLLMFFLILQLLGNDSEARFVSEHGYQGCVELANKHVRVVLEPNVGGRIIVYALNGKNVLRLNPDEIGWTPDKKVVDFGPSAGRFDIGPEKITPRRRTLFVGKWKAEITGSRSARMTSQKDDNTGVQLIREFKLDDKTSYLSCIQIIKNISDETKRYCHWSRTFAKGGGISLTPLNPNSRYPKGYILYGPGDVMDFNPADEPNIRIREGILEIIGPPSRAKFAIDTYHGWLAYLSKNNLLFIKKFPTYPDRVYGEMAANTVSIWYKDDRMCEIEPIGPWEEIPPGKSVSFTEDWWLYDFLYPEDRVVDLGVVRQLVEEIGNEPDGK